jgi:hypothetical protein
MHWGRRPGQSFRHNQDETVQMRHFFPFFKDEGDVIASWGHAKLIKRRDELKRDKHPRRLGRGSLEGCCFVGRNSFQNEARADQKAFKLLAGLIENINPIPAP